MPREKRRARPENTSMPDPLAEKKRRLEEEPEDDPMVEEEGEAPPIIKKTKKNATITRKNLKNEILEKYNECTGKNLSKYGQIDDPYTVVEAYLMTETGKAKGIRYSHFAAIFNDKIKSARTAWFKDIETVEDSIVEKWNIPLIQSLADVDTSLAVCFIMKHCFNKETGEFFLNTLSFSALREYIKHEVVRVLKVWGVEGVEKLEEYMSYPRFMENLSKNAHEMHRIGVSSVTLNFDTKNLLEKEYIASVFR